MCALSQQGSTSLQGALLLTQLILGKQVSRCRKETMPQPILLNIINNCCRNQEYDGHYSVDISPLTRQETGTSSGGESVAGKPNLRTWATKVHTQQ
ncbi:hypothetical protein IF2G_06004 [Cordyceps javanica]|nr:hypothetical protein IF2G_06004 [Cordyceps javanica]